MVLEMEILNELRNMSGKLDCSRNNLSAINEHIKELLAWKKARLEITLANQYTIANSGDSYTTTGVNNPGYNRCRLELAAVFVSGSASGLGVQMVYGNSPVGKVMDALAVNGSAIMRSEPIDVKELNAFQFEIHNRDPSNSVTLRTVKVILYND